MPCGTWSRTTCVARPARCRTTTPRPATMRWPRTPGSRAVPTSTPREPMRTVIRCIRPSMGIPTTAKSTRTVVPGRDLVAPCPNDRASGPPAECCRRVSNMGYADCSDGLSNTMVVGEQSDYLQDVDVNISAKYRGDPGLDGCHGNAPRLDFGNDGKQLSRHHGYPFGTGHLQHQHRSLQARLEEGGRRGRGDQRLAATVLPGCSRIAVAVAGRTTRCSRRIRAESWSRCATVRCSSLPEPSTWRSSCDWPSAMTDSRSSWTTDPKTPRWLAQPPCSNDVSGFLL